MLRADLLKPDFLSEIVLLGSAVLTFVLLLVIVMVACQNLTAIQLSRGADVNKHSSRRNSDRNAGADGSRLAQTPLNC
jgi:hypothetical protein